MKGKGLIFFFGVLATTAVIIYTMVNSGSKLDYYQQMKKERSDYKNYLAADTSLIPDGDTTGISFFPIDRKYLVSAKVVPLEKTDIIHIRTSGEEHQKFIKHAKLKFEIDKKELELTLLRSTEQGHFFLPFSDATSGKETYGAGRYLPVHFVDGEDLVLDFNLAFNPKCAYNHHYICPVPPQENHLDFPIKAGEKTYSKN